MQHSAPNTASSHCLWTSESLCKHSRASSHDPYLSGKSVFLPQRSLNKVQRCNGSYTPGSSSCRLSDCRSAVLCAEKQHYLVALVWKSPCSCPTQLRLIPVSGCKLEKVHCIKNLLSWKWNDQKVPSCRSCCCWLTFPWIACYCAFDFRERPRFLSLVAYRSYKNNNMVWLRWQRWPELVTLAKTRH